MNDFEHKLRDTPLRRPPAAWRGEILAAIPANRSAVANWREWLWPPPIAWAALAAVWLILLTIELASGGMPARLARGSTSNTVPPDSLLALRHEQALALMR